MLLKVPILKYLATMVSCVSSDLFTPGKYHISNTGKKACASPRGCRNAANIHRMSRGKNVCKSDLLATH